MIWIILAIIAAFLLGVILTAWFIYWGTIQALRNMF